MVRKGKNNRGLEFDFNMDLNVKEIKKDDNTDYTKYASVPDKVIPVSEYVKEDFDVQKWYSSPLSKSNSIYHTFIREQIDELREVKENALNEYLNSLVQPGQTLIESNRRVAYWLVRIQRLRELLEGRHSTLLVSHTKKDQKYYVAKGYWPDDYGNVSRNYSKSILKLGYGIENKLRDIYEELGYEVRENVMFNKDRKRIADMVIKKGEQEYVVECSKMELKDLAKFYLNYSMWLDYKEIYQKMEGR
jgi:hypothetical protein